MWCVLAGFWTSINKNIKQHWYSPCFLVSMQQLCKNRTLRKKVWCWSLHAQTCAKHIVYMRFLPFNHFPFAQLRSKKTALGGTATVGISSKHFLQHFSFVFFRPPMINPREKTKYSEIFSRYSAGQRIWTHKCARMPNMCPKQSLVQKTKKTFGPFAEEPPRSSLAFFS